MSEQEAAQLANLFSAVLSASSNEQRQAAEAQLAAVRNQSPSFAASLLRLVAEQQRPAAMRQMAAVVLRRYVETGWSVEGFYEVRANKLKSLHALSELDQKEEEMVQRGEIQQRVPEQLKPTVRSMLLAPQLIGQSSSKLRTAVAGIVAMIGQYDFPEQWPELVPSLVNMIGSSSDANVVQGCVRALLLLTEHLTAETQRKIANVTLPALLRVIQTGGKFPAWVLAHCVMIYRKSVLTIGHLGGDEAVKLVAPTFNSWLQVLVAVLKSPPNQRQNNAELSDSHQFVDCTMHMACARTLFSLVNAKWLRKTLAPNVAGFAQMCLVALQQIGPLYTKQYVLRSVTDDTLDDSTKEYDEDGHAIGLSMFAAQLFEVLHIIIESSKPGRAALAPKVDQIAALALSFSHITALTEREWLKDDTEFAFDEVAHKTETYSVRSTALALLSALADQWRADGARAVCKGALQFMAQSAQLRSSGNAHWWRWAEAGLAGLSALELSSASSAAGPLLPSVFEKMIVPFTAARSQPIQRDDQAGSDPVHVLLRARALLSGSGLLMTMLYMSLPPKQDEGTLVANQQAMPTVQTVVNNIVANTKQGCHTIERIAAAKAVCMVALSSSNEATPLPTSLLVNVLTAVFQPLCHLMTVTRSHSLNVALETLSVLMDVDEDAAAGVATNLTPLLLKVWSTNVDNNEIVVGVSDMIKLLAGNAKCAQGVQSIVLPTLMNVLQNASNHQPGVVEQAIDLLTGLLVAWKKLSVGIPTPLLASSLGIVLSLMMTSDDTKIIESGSLALMQFIKLSAQQIGTCKFEQNNNSNNNSNNSSNNNNNNGAAVPSAFVGRPMLSVLCEVVGRLLNPDSADTGACQVGHLVNQLIYKFGGQIGQNNVLQLLRATFVRLHASHYATLTQTLLLVFARLVHSQGAAGVVSFLVQLGTMQLRVRTATQAIQGTLGADKSQWPVENVQALQFVLQRWVDMQPDFLGSYDANVTLSALAKLVMLNDSRVNNVPCKGVPVDGPSTQFANADGSQRVQTKWTTVPFVAKVVSLMASRWDYIQLSKNRNEKLQRNVARAVGGGAAASGLGDIVDLGFGTGGNGDGSSLNFGGGDDFDDDYDDDLDDDDLDDDDFDALGYGDEDDLDGLDLSHLLTMAMDDDVDESDPEIVQDPLFKMHLGNFIIKFMQNMASSMQAIGQHLSKDEQESVQSILSAKLEPEENKSSN
eukprot:TRINITY_DN66091_c6_g1_i1.p1 TRINITY_DN66091_c6_g1~~TRINITY_DN66091_c6_g1_i1.p1  ORF type:complete len:1211 (+),score=690.25 TRINITY_DN66091_c6_g1_i1:43-3675(+)